MKNQKYHLIPLAVILIIAASYSLATTIKILASDINNITMPGISPDISAICTFSYSNWSDCSNTEKQIRTVINKSASGCVVNPEELQRNCAYTAPSCTYAYGDWSDCASSGTQTRSVKSQTPNGCTGKPETQRACDYSDSTNHETNEQNNSLADTTPSFVFSNLVSEQQIAGFTTFKGKVTDASAVEYYLIPIGSNTRKYIGSADYTNDNYWAFEFNSTSFPNGSFYLSAKIKNKYGSYDGPKIKINIANTASAAVTAILENTATASSDARTAPRTTQNSENAQNYNGETSQDWQNKYFGNMICADADYCGENADPDKDNLINKDEMRFGTEPKNPDSDGDGFLDGDEIKNGFNPTKYAPGDKTDKIVFESPKETGEIKKETYVVTRVVLVENDLAKKGLKLEGKGLPNSFINIYIYSNDPIILTVKTDANGDWSYILDKDLENGDHEVYVAITDNTGKIQAKSEAVAFIKTAEAASITPPAETSNLAEAISPTEKRKDTDLFVLSMIAILTFATAIIIIGLRIMHTHKPAKI